MAGDPFSMIAGIAGAAGNVISQHMANETNIQLAREQRDFYYQQWLRENAYNDPKAQMARLQAAGLNPALMYGDGASGMQGSASMADVEAARVAAPQVDPLTLASIANIDAQTEKIKSETKQSNELHPFNLQNLQLNNDVLAQRLKNLTAEEQLTYADITYKAVLSDVTEKNASVQRELWNSQKDLADSEKLKSDEEYRQAVALFSLRQQGLELQNDELLARVGVAEADRDRILKVVSLMERDMLVKEKMAETGWQDAITHRASHNANVAINNHLLPFEKGLKQQQINVQAAQARYWNDFTRHPGKYRSTSVHLGPFGYSD